MNSAFVAYQTFPPGDTAPELKTADFILTHRVAMVSKAISVGQKLRYKNSGFSFWNHAAFICNPQGDLIEALTRGVTRSHISKYKDTEYTVVRLNNASADDRAQALKFAEWCVGQKYGFVTILNLALWSLFGGKFDFSMDGQEICSGLVARALERTGEIFPSDPSRLPPAGLAKHFMVVVPH